MPPELGDLRAWADNRLMHFLRHRVGGFTLVELIVVMVLAVVVTTLAVISVSSRLRTSTLESSAQELASAIATARTTALYKKCPTRIIFCADAACTDYAASTATDDSGSYIAVGGAPAAFMAIVRMAYYGAAHSQRSCYFPGATDPSPALLADSGDSAWDFERKPIRIPQDLRITPIYIPEVLTTTTWTVSSPTDSGRSSDEAINSIWFPTSISSLPSLTHMRAEIPGNIPVQNGLLANGSAAFLQLKMAHCDPAADEDCAGYLIGLGAGGEASLVICEQPSGTRANSTNQCF